MSEAIFEFRDYTLHAGKRDVLIDLFEREFVESQERLGANVRATFRDLDNPNHFVWIRSFADAHARFAALDAFYTSAIWRKYRSVANATIADSDNVLQLRPHFGAIPNAPRPPIGAGAASDTLFLAVTYFPKSVKTFADHFENATLPHLREIHTAPFACFMTEDAPNAYPRLPVRTDNVYLTITRFETPAAFAECEGALASIEKTLGLLLIAPSEARRLAPTARSSLR